MQSKAENLLDLPVEMLLHVFNQLNDSDRNKLFNVNRQIRQLITDNYIKNLYGKLFGVKAFLKEQRSILKMDLDNYYQSQTFAYSGIMFGRADLRASQRCMWLNRVLRNAPDFQIILGIISGLLFVYITFDKLVDHGFFSLYFWMVTGTSIFLILNGINGCIDRAHIAGFNDALTNARMNLNTDIDTVGDFRKLLRKNSLLSFLFSQDREAVKNIRTNKDVKNYLEGKKQELNDLIDAFDQYHKSIAGSQIRALDLDAFVAVKESPKETAITLVNKDAFVYLINQWNKLQDTAETNSQMIIPYKNKLI